MSTTATTRTDQYNATTRTLFVALELGEKDWKLALGTQLDHKPLLRTIRARDRDRLLEEIERVGSRLETEQVTVCYEAGRDGFWLKRFLEAQGVECLIVDSASIEVRRRARRTKTDRLDALKLLSMLIRFALGERDVWSVVRVPSVADEDARSLHREYRTLIKERTRSANRIRGLLASQGLRALRIDGDFLAWIDRAQLWDGSPVPPGLRLRIEREYARFEFTHTQILEIQKDRRDRVRDQEGPALNIVRQLFALRGIGLGSAWTYTMEFFAWRQFTSAKQVGSLAGLAPTPYRSGTLEKELGITKAGNRFVRSLAIEIAWGWLRHQPDSALTRWYVERFARGGPRARKVGIVALARKLLVALWRYVETGVLPQGAQLKA